MDELRLNEYEWIALQTGGLGDAPCGRWGHSAFSVDQTTLFIGGTNHFENGLADVYSFSEEIGWNRICTRNCPTLSAHTANLLGRHIYCFGGDGRETNTDVWDLDLDLMAWSVLEVTGKCPLWRRTAASVTINGLIYIIGGWGVGGPMNDVNILNVAGSPGQWTIMDIRAPELTLPQRGSHSATAMGAEGAQQIVVYGGFNGKQLADLWVLDTRLLRPTWHSPQTTGVAPIEGRSGHSATAVGSHLILLFGEKQFDETFYHDLYVLNVDSMAWHVIQVSGTAPPSRGWHSATLLDGSDNAEHGVGSRILVFGGGRYESFFDDVHVLDLAAGGMPSLPPDDLASDLRRLLLDGQNLADVTFTFEDGQLMHAHSHLLCARSRVYNAMLSETWTQGKQASIKIDDVPADSFRMFLEFLYTGTCSFDSASHNDVAEKDGENDIDARVRHALDLLPLSSMHMLPRLQAQCVNVLERAVKQRAKVFMEDSLALRHLLSLSELYDLSSLSRLVRAALAKQQ